MRRASEHAAFAANLALDATDDLAREDRVAAYRKLYTARTEIEAAIAHIQIHHPHAVFEANRVMPISARAEDEVVHAFAGVETPAAPSPIPHFRPTHHVALPSGKLIPLLVNGGTVS